jgi:hypothetical protein
VDIIFNNSDLDYMNIDGYSINSIKKNKFIDKCKIVKPVEDIEFPVIKHKVNHVIFNTDIIHNMLYFIYLITKYDNLKIPLYCDSGNITEIAEIAEINKNGGIGKNISELVETINKYFCELIPSLILWSNSTVNFIHPKLGKCISNLMKDEKCRYIVIKVSIIKIKNMFHANIILFDKNDLTYRRFEPYGASVIPDIDVLDNYILKMFNKPKIKCYRPQDYLELTRFQSVSNDTHQDNKITGDPYGFCLAWCFWYIEIKIKNSNLSEKNLIQKASDKIFATYCDSYSPYNDFIRDYAAMLDEEKNKLLEKCGIKFMEYYKKTFTDEQIKLISEGVKHYL